MKSFLFNPNTPIQIDENDMQSFDIPYFESIRTPAPAYRVLSDNHVQRNYGKLVKYGLPFSVANTYREQMIAANPLIAESEINQNMFELSQTLKSWILEVYTTDGWNEPPIYLRNYDFTNNCSALVEVEVVEEEEEEEEERETEAK